jgi:hypothetical protein
MARPEIDDEHIEKLSEIIDNSTAVPLPSDELSVNQQFRIVVEAVYEEMQRREEDNQDMKILIDRHYLDE